MEHTAILSAPGSYRGTFAADDFSDNYSTPVVHVRWWGSYENNNNLLFPNANVQKFLISFESDTIGGPANQPFSQPGTPLLTQEVTLGGLSPGSGTFTEQMVNGNVPEHLYQYNAELALPFNEQANTVYWLKIVALEDPSTQNLVKWGWHNRDWGVKDNLASPVPVPGEHDEGPLVLSNGTTPVWHFQDDAVNGQIDYGLNTAGVWQINSEFGMAPAELPIYSGGGTDRRPSGISELLRRFIVRVVHDCARARHNCPDAARKRWDGDCGTVSEADMMSDFASDKKS